MIVLPDPEHVDLRDRDTALGWALRRWVADQARDKARDGRGDDEAAARFANYT